jgi:cell cycle sensor histidine kinase DivJ
LLGAVAAACGRMVHGSVVDEATRAHHGRLIGLLLTGPLLVAAALAVFLSPRLGPGATLSAIGATVALSLLGAAVVSRTGRGVAFVEAGALVLSAIAAAAVVAAAGGPASPALLILAALPFEAWWLRRSAGAAGLGALAALAALVLQGALGSTALTGATIPAGWHWVAPLTYLAFVAPRMAIWIESLTRSKQQPEGSLEAVIDAVVLRLTEGGEVVDASAQARDMIGVAPAMLLDSGLFDRIHVADRVAYMCALADIRHGGRSPCLELRIRRTSTQDGRHTGEYLPFLVEMTRTGSDQIIAVIRKPHSKVELRAQPTAEKDATECAELAKTRFLAAVSHELRTPLNAIIGFSDLLLHEMFGGFRDPRQKEYVRLVREAGHHLLDVVNSILDVSRIEAGAYTTHPEPFRFRDAVDTCHSMLSLQAANKKLEMLVDVSPEIGEILADRRAVQQMLINLVANAIKFTPRTGGS